MNMSETEKYLLELLRSNINTPCEIILGGKECKIDLESKGE